MPDKSDLYLLKRNIYYYLRNEILFDEYELNDFSFSEAVTEETLIVNSTNTKRYDMAYNNLIYNVATSAVIVYKNGFEVASSNYTINYRDGYILFNDSYTISSLEIITCSYSRMVIDVRLAFSYEEVSEDDLPIVTIDLETTVKAAVELGTTLSYKDRGVYFTVYATNVVELDGIVSLLESSFDESRIQILNYREEEPLTGEGFINPNFVGVNYGNYEMSIEHIRTDTLYPATPNEVDKHSMMIQSTVRSFI